MPGYPCGCVPISPPPCCMDLRVMHGDIDITGLPSITNFEVGELYTCRAETKEETTIPFHPERYLLPETIDGQPYFGVNALVDGEHITAQYASPVAAEPNAYGSNTCIALGPNNGVAEVQPYGVGSFELIKNDPNQVYPYFFHLEYAIIRSGDDCILRIGASIGDPFGESYQPTDASDFIDLSNTRLLVWNINFQWFNVENTAYKYSDFYPCCELPRPDGKSPNMGIWTGGGRFKALDAAYISPQGYPRTEPWTKEELPFIDQSITGTGIYSYNQLHIYWEINLTEEEIESLDDLPELTLTTANASGAWDGNNIETSALYPLTETELNSFILTTIYIPDSLRPHDNPEYWKIAQTENYELKGPGGGVLGCIETDGPGDAYYNQLSVDRMQWTTRAVVVADFQAIYADAFSIKFRP